MRERERKRRDKDIRKGGRGELKDPLKKIKTIKFLPCLCLCACVFLCVFVRAYIKTFLSKLPYQKIGEDSL